MIGSILGVLTLICFALFIKAKKRISDTLARLQAQGVTSYPGNTDSLIGPVSGLERIYFADAKAKKTTVEGALPTALVWILQRLTEKTRKPGEPAIDASKNRMVALNMVGKVVTYVQDPDVINDMYIKHGQSLDKSTVIQEMYEPLFTQFLPLTSNSDH